MNSINHFSYLSVKPLKLLKNRVWRTYTGGKLLDEWYDTEQPSDGNYPEEWLASTVNARNIGRDHIANEGLSLVEYGFNEYFTLKQIIETNPVAFLGKKHVERFNSNTAILVKLLDSSERLAIQVHPDKKFAKKFFNSEFGKTEAWYIISGRKIDGVDPYVLLGFKPGVTREKWNIMFENQDIKGMIDSLHKINIKEGDTFLIEGGTPHAIGPGCFIIEIQEPTDFTIRVERTKPSGVKIHDMACHQGLGFDKIMDCFNYQANDKNDTFAKWKICPTIKSSNESSKVIEIIGEKHTKCFKAELVEIKDEYTLNNGGIFCIMLVMSGEGKFVANGQVTIIKKSDIYFVPANLMKLKINNASENELKVLLFFPPHVS